MGPRAAPAREGKALTQDDFSCPICGGEADSAPPVDWPDMPAEVTVWRGEACGPRCGPQARQDGRRVANAGDVRKWLTLLIDLRDALPDRSNEP